MERLLRYEEIKHQIKLLTEELDELKDGALEDALSTGLSSIPLSSSTCSVVEKKQYDFSGIEELSFLENDIDSKMTDVNAFKKLLNNKKKVLVSKNLVPLLTTNHELRITFD